MNLKKLVHFWLNPRFIIKNYPTDLTVDRFIRLLIEHKDEVELVILRKVIDGEER